MQISSHRDLTGLEVTHSKPAARHPPQSCHSNRKTGQHGPFRSIIGSTLATLEPIEGLGLRSPSLFTCIHAEKGSGDDVRQTKSCEKLTTMDRPEPELYFAYGSNMSSRRLQARIPGVLSHGIGWMRDRRLVCNRRGKDGSGKANLADHPRSIAWGVLFRLEQGDWPQLDAFEPGYSRLACDVCVPTSGSATAADNQGEYLLKRAQVYLWTNRGPELEPLDWYRNHLLEGAREHGLPTSHIDLIEKLGLKA